MTEKNGMENHTKREENNEINTTFLTGDPKGSKCKQNKENICDITKSKAFCRQVTTLPFALVLSVLLKLLNVSHPLAV